jgi:hypothetical protein
MTVDQNSCWRHATLVVGSLFLEKRRSGCSMFGIGTMELLLLAAIVVIVVAVIASSSKRRI